MPKLTVKDIRKAIEGMADDAPVALDMADPPDDYGYSIDGIANYGGTLQISVSEDEDDEDEVEVEEEYKYEVTFKAVVTATDEADAADQARDTISHGDYEPTEVKRLDEEEPA